MANGMDTEYLLVFTVLMTMLLLVIQRTERSKRLIVIAVMLIPAILIRNWIVYIEREREGQIALLLSLILSFLFWWLIGRYNPVGSSDDIQVLGLDD